MLTKLSVDQALMKAKSHAQKGDILEAQKIYQAIFETFSQEAKDTQQVLANLNKTRQNNEIQNPPQEVLDQLVNLYNKGQLAGVVEQAQFLTKQYPKTFIIWNILGAANKGLGQIERASKAFKKVTELNPNYADGFNNLGVTLKDQGKMDEALEAYNRALSIKPDYAVTYLNMGITLKDQGNLDNAIKAYNKALLLNPNYAEAYNYMGDALVEQGKLNEAIEAYNKSISLKPDYAEAYNNMGNASIDLGKLGEAIHAYKKSISLKPDYAEAYNNMGVAFQGQGKLNDAIESYNKAISLNPDFYEAYNNKGLTYENKGKLEEAIKEYRKSISLKPDYAEAYYNMGANLKDQGKIEEAIEAYNKAFSIKPDYAEAYNNMGVALIDQGKLDEAIDAFNKALSIKSDFTESYNNIGVALKDQGKLNEAIDAFNKALSIKADYADAYNNMGNAFKDLGKLREAIDAYKKSILLKPDYANGFVNLGVALKKQGKLDESMEAYNKALLIKPDYAEAYYNIGNTLIDQSKMEEAIEAFDKALLIKPDYEAARAHKLHQQAQICDWNSLDKDNKLIPTLGISKKSINPFSMLSLEDAPERHHLRSKIYAKNMFTEKPMPFPNKPLKKLERIRIGYFSSDFFEHPVAYLIAKVIELHNRDKFEIFAYSLMGSKEDELRKRLINSFDVFKDVSELNDREVAVLCRQDNIDIAIDLNGHTQNSRSKIFAYRAAPIQINYLGFPGTMGTGFMDYIIADQHLIPPENSKYYTENQLYLPNTYMPTDNSRQFSNRVISRSEMGLPNKAFVFCCFNNNYKITKVEFNIWMRLLSKVKGSVLWLSKSNQVSYKNIIKAAKERNIDPSRLVFANKLPIDEHLSRHKLADLFIDTFAFNAHTTTTEALWSGLPVVTKQGKGFPARVAASLLNSIGLSELITSSESEYETLILELAMNPTKLRKVKEKLDKNRLSHPLFNTELYTKHLENGYLTAYQNYYDGKYPENIIVKE